MNDPRSLAIRRSAKAESDLLEIWLYIAEQDAGAADRVLDEIARVWGLIATPPQMGRERPDILPGIRSLAVMAEFVEVVRVLHGARDLDDFEF